jgi:hypothetical protein
MRHDETSIGSDTHCRDKRMDGLLRKQVAFIVQAFEKAVSSVGEELGVDLDFEPVGSYRSKESDYFTALDLLISPKSEW